MRFLDDLVHLKRNFAELGPTGWQGLLSSKKGKHAELAARAWPIWIADYDLSDAGEHGIPPQAAREYLTALKAGRVPQWVQDMALGPDIRRAAGR